MQKTVLASLVLVLTASWPALAQPPAPQSPKLGSLDVTVNWRSRTEMWDWFEGNTGNSDYGLGHSQVRVSLGQKRSKVDCFVEGEAVTVFALPTDVVAPAPLGQLGLGGTYYTANSNSANNTSAFLKQAYLQFKQLGQMDLKVGRFEFFDAVEARSSDPLVTAIVNQRVAHRLISNSASPRSSDRSTAGSSSGTPVPTTSRRSVGDPRRASSKSAA